MNLLIMIIIPMLLIYFIILKINDIRYLKLYENEMKLYLKLDIIISSYFNRNILELRKNYDQYLIFSDLYGIYLKYSTINFNYSFDRKLYLHYKELNEKTLSLFSDFFPEIKTINRDIKIKRIIR